MNICFVPNKCIPGENVYQLGNKWDSSQDKEGVRAANKHKGNVWASVQDHVSI